MHSALFILLPPLAVLRTGRVAAAVFNFLLTLCGWIPGVLHAYAIVADDDSREQARRRLDELRRANGREGMRMPPEIAIVRKEPACTAIAVLLAGATCSAAVFGPRLLSRWVGPSQPPPGAPPISSPPESATQPPIAPAAANDPIASVATPSIPADPRSIAAILRERVNWPTKVSLRVPLTVTLFDRGERVGEATLDVGQLVTASSIADDGMLSLAVAQQTVQLDMTNTDFLDRASRSDSSAASEPGTAAAVNAATNANVARARTLHSVDERLRDLKQHFPPQYRTAVGTIITDRVLSAPNVRPVGAAGQVRTGHNPIGAVGRYDTISFEVPTAEIWSDYRGWITTATVESLPATIARLDAKIQKDLVQLTGDANSASGNGRRAQAAATVTWIRATFLPYLGQFKALCPKG